MQVLTKPSGVNPVSQMDMSDHIDAEWPAKAIAWLCAEGAKKYAGREVSLKDDAIRQKIGLASD